MPSIAWSRPRGRFSRFAGILPLLPFCSAGSLLGSAFVLFLQLERGREVPLGTAAAFVFFAVGLLQGGMAWSVLRRHRIQQLRPRLHPLPFVAWMLAGTVLCYLIALPGGATAGADLFASGLAIWYTLAWLPWTEQAPLQSLYQRLLRSKAASRTARIGFILMLGLLGTEGLLRGYAWWAEEELFQDNLHRDVPESSCAAAFNSRPAWFHATLIGEAQLLGGASAQAFVAQMEERAPGVEMACRPLQAGGLSGAIHSLPELIEPGKTDLVVLFVSPADELCREEASGGLFDWHSVQLLRWASRVWDTKQETCSSAVPEATVDAHLHLRTCERRLSVCDTSPDEARQRRWQRLEAQLAKASETCRRHHAALAIVLVPEAYQVQRTLGETVRRRSGREAGQVDWELPQRRMAALAARQEIALLDMLPVLSKSDDLLYARNSSRWNDLGRETVAETVGQWLNARYGSTIAAAAATKLR